jgi:hypothetical protein
MDPKQSRGYRNKNPGNIDYNVRNRWQGQVGIEATGNPPRFAVFESHEYGIRALAALLTTYQDRHGLRTIRGIVNRWAPPKGDSNGAAPGGEYTQNTSGYVDHVCKLTGFAPDAPLDLHTYEDLRPLVEAIITHELGGNPYDAVTIDAGLRLAGVRKPGAEATPKPATDAGILGGVAGAAAAIAPAVSSLSGLHWAVGVAVVAGVVAVVAVSLLSRQRAA